MIYSNSSLIGKELISHLCLQENQFLTYGAAYCGSMYCKLTINTN